MRHPLCLLLAAALVAGIGAGCDPERTTGEVPEGPGQATESVEVGDVATQPQTEPGPTEDDTDQ